MSEHSSKSNHPTPKTYAIIAVILCVITFVEFVLFYVESLKSIFVPLLLVLSAAKFVLVAKYYMHLKFDHPVFKKLLMGGMLVGSVLLGALFVLFTYSHPI